MYKNKIKPCRICKKIPKKNYPESRIINYDWICNKCYDGKRQEKRVLKRHALEPVDTENITKAIKDNIKNLDLRQDGPFCVFCTKQLSPIRSMLKEGAELLWTCRECNDIISHEKL